MRTRWMIWGTAVLFAYCGYQAGSLAAAYVAIAAGAIFHLLHTIEVKVNRLLDHHRIIVSDREIAQD